MLLLETEKQRSAAAPLFDGWDETMIWSALQGRMGKVWADDRECPTCAMVLNGDLCFAEGAYTEQQMAEAAAILQSAAQGNEVIFTTRNKEWEAGFLAHYAQRCTPETRYAIHKDHPAFDLETLWRYEQSLPSPLRMVDIDAELWERVRGEEWCRDFVSQFVTAEQYEQEGLGVLALDGEKIVGGASSYIVYDGGIEIQVDTHAEYRRRGIARACCARLIRRCLERGLYPSWDAANRASVELALQLGYREKGAYPILEIRLA